MTDSKLQKGKVTRYSNQIGLYDQGNKEFITNSGKVVINFPFKDCILEGGMTKEDVEREERYLCEMCDQADIDTLFEPKVLTNFKYINREGERQLTTQDDIEFFDENGELKQNLLIKGNNLLALHSLKRRLAGQVKLIYIDPPYNTGTDSFKYNDNFNHSTWLVFMKNRLEIARELLRDDGVIFVQCDHHESHYLKVLMDEEQLFTNNFVQEIIVKTSSPAGFKLANPGAAKVTESILVFAKDKSKYIMTENKLYVEGTYPNNYNKYIENIDEPFKKWKISDVKKQCLIAYGFNNIDEAKQKWGKETNNIIKALIPSFAMLHAKQIFTTYAPQDPGLQLKQLCYDSKKSPQKIFKYKNYYIYNGRLMSFYNTKLKNIDGEMKPTEHLTNLWTDISWGGITKEGGVMMNKAKKPEKLIQRIIELSTNKNDIILDFFLGYGTTAAVAHKMDRRWIGIEQMDYMETSTKKRISNVIFGDKTGISKAVDWQGGGSFVYLELKKYNQRIIDLIWAATNKEQIKEIYKEIQQNAFVNFWFDHKAFEKEEEWSKLPLEEQKGLLIDIIDQNQLYLNLLDMDDTSHEVSEIEKVLTRRFYGEK